MREAFFGVRRFSDFRRNLGIARNTLADRLNRLVERGVLSKRRVAKTNEWQEYRLTEMGLDLYPIVIALMRWGDKWRAPGAPPLRVTHRDCGGELTLQVSCKACGAIVDARGAEYAPGPGSSRVQASRSGS